MPPTLVRGQWKQNGTGDYQSAYTYSDGTLKDIQAIVNNDGVTIDNGTSVGQWGGNTGPNDVFGSWAQGGCWDLLRSQWIAGCANSGFPTLDLNVFDVPSGTWNPGGNANRPQRSYSEFVSRHKASWDYSVGGYGLGNPGTPGAFIDVNNHYSDVATVNTNSGAWGGPLNKVLLPNTGHHTGSLVWMPSVGRVGWAGSYGLYISDNSNNLGVWEWDPVTKKWSLDIQGNDYQPDVDNPPVCAVWDSRRNRMLAVTGAQSSDGSLFAYDPAKSVGSRITRIFNHQLGVRVVGIGVETGNPMGVYDAKRDQLRVYGSFHGTGQFGYLNGQYGIFSFSSGGGTANNPALTGFTLSGDLGVLTSDGPGILYDPVADKDVVWLSNRTLYVIDPDTHVATALTPLGDDPGIPTGFDTHGPMIWGRFAYLPAYDTYAVIPRQNTTGVYLFAPDRTSGALVFISQSRLVFTDLSQGPRTGNSDTAFGQTANVDGAYVTVWGQNLGSTQGASTLTLGGIAPRIISWGNATGPAANLFNGYQKLQAIVFQIDHTTPLGVQSLVVTVSGKTSVALPFTVASSGAIRFSSQYASVQAMVDALTSGDVGYVQTNAPAGITLNNVTGNFTAPAALVAYPGATAQFGSASFNGVTRGASGSGPNMVYGQLAIFGGPGNGDEGVTIDNNGRLVGCLIQAPNGHGSSGSVGGRGSNLVFLGNEFTNCGSAASFDDQYHTLYIYGYSLSSSAAFNLESEREVGWNYFHTNNNALRAINIFHGNPGGTEDPITHHRIHDNVIVNSVGDAIVFGQGVVGENWLYNNLVIGAGAGLFPTNAAGFNCRAQDPPGVLPSGLPPLIHCFNNTFINCGVSGQSIAGTFELVSPVWTPDFHNNLVYQTNGFPYFSTDSQVPTGVLAEWSHNLWYGAGSAPSGDHNSVNADPQLVSSASPYDLHLAATSPAIRAGTNLDSFGPGTVDLDGNSRVAAMLWTIGAYEPPAVAGNPPSVGLEVFKYRRV